MFVSGVVLPWFTWRRKPVIDYYDVYFFEYCHCECVILFCSLFWTLLDFEMLPIFLCHMLTSATHFLRTTTAGI